ncbi:calcium-binding protein [Aliikangiella coralliicola]|uniref:calcium-binding protein n=1 Tax=Aliikangiella coralliicola TaxID=2592383 RepID=UPI00143D6A26|nr:hypothetical protein [Aliikangiella coralliicola]
MKTSNKMTTSKKTMYFTKTFLLSGLFINNAFAEVLIGTDQSSASSTENEIVSIYSANRGTNGGGDQSLQLGDMITGSNDSDVLIGGLGIDILFGGLGDDILIGGTEDFNGFNRDRAFGEEGDDSFLWAPGDGNDFFDGGPGTDVLFMTLIGESKDSNGNTEQAPFFAVSPPSPTNLRDFDGIHLNDQNLPVINVPAGPGFCEIVEQDAENKTALEELGLEHLIRFVLRGPRANFESEVAADPNLDPATLDDGLRVAIHLKNVEFLVCTGKTAGTQQIFDLRQVPAQEVDASQLPLQAYQLLSAPIAD